MLYDDPLHYIVATAKRYIVLEEKVNAYKTIFPNCQRRSSALCLDHLMPPYLPPPSCSSLPADYNLLPEFGMDPPYNIK